MFRNVWIFSVVVMQLALASAAGAHTIITRMSDRQSISMPEMVAAAEKTDLVLVGEVHTNKDHHDLQLDLLRSLNQGRPRLAIGLEMIPATKQRQLDQWSAGRLSEPSMRAVFEESWTDWGLYREIFLFARDHRVPMVALDVPGEVVRKVSQSGFKSLTPKERSYLPVGTSCDLRNPQIALLRKAFAQHFQEKVFNYFCEAQTVRNSGMAINLARYLREHPGHRVAVLTGVWHAVKYAIPEQLARNGSRLSFTVILPETPELNADSAGFAEADYLFDM
ncbi:hypothetical protein GMST_29140 [Geomonas silvestris]|uniref:Haem-binding uptake Tiki superfamily ChaN domain-containing protein n=1 Tax=Geomonas silvestris TaxID=2740184 RepID=A0A6V8MLT3_9BACT|nr:ChaN family lipoprotein [Geomonas silvestris]GFO60589.1 hypothetical protein GMST_29140 [Geomonas silvestris]